MSMKFLPAFGAIPVDERVVIDGHIITGGGVTAGIDFGLRVVAQIADEETARRIQLAIEYDPHPPFASGHPRAASPALVDAVTDAAAQRQSERRAQVERAAELLRTQRD
jgi:cyclohexyl-isocyanide hydratase